MASRANARDDRSGPTPFVFESAGRTVFGAGALDHVGALLADLGARRCVLVSDGNLDGPARRIQALAAQASIEVTIFDGGEAEPTVDVVERARAAAPPACDTVIGLGGGSNLDVAKGLAVLLAHGGHITDYVGQGRLPGPPRRLVAIPTTAGSGSEVSAACVLGIPADASKVAIVDRRLRPAIALVDPRLHLSCPPAVTRDAGLDALTHAIEALTIADPADMPRDPAVAWPLYQGKHPVTDALATRAIADIGSALPRVMAEPADLDARSDMAIAANLTGAAMACTGIHLTHALAYPVGAMTGASHGACNGALLPAVLDFIAEARPDEDRTIADLLGAPGKSAGDAVRMLQGRVQAPDLVGLGLRRDQLAPAAAIAHGIARLRGACPRPSTVAEVEQVLVRAWETRS